MADPQQSAPTVLVVEDDFAARESLAALLKRRGYQVATPRNGAVAVALLASWVDPDIVILDVLVSDGRRFVDELRRSRPRAVPVILTGRVDLSARWPGVVGFLYKPVDEGELVATIGQALKRRVGSL
jgi:CheY-like chemotaxis protein